MVNCDIWAYKMASFINTKLYKITRKSGLELNADKTEILSLSTDRPRTYDIEYNGGYIQLTTMKEIGMRGIWDCNDHDRECHVMLNITANFFNVGPP